MPRGKKGSGADDILAAVRRAAEAEAGIEPEEKPDYVDIDGTRYYRTKAAAAEPVQRNTKGEIVVPVTINIAPHAPHIRIDNRIYFNGYTYLFTEAEAASIRECMHNTWRHERATGGANVALGSSRNLEMNARTGMVTTSRLGAPGVPGA